MEHGRGVRREPQNSSIPTARFNQGIATLNPSSHTGGTYSHMMDYSRFPISEMHLGKFPDSLEFQSWKVNFKTEVWAKSSFSHIIMHWINGVEIAKSTNDLMTPRSITGPKDVPDFGMLDAMIASALKKLLTHVHFRKRVSVQEQRAQKDDRFSRGMQIAYMKNEHCRATGAHEAVQGLSDKEISKIQKCLHPHTFFMTQIRNVQQKWHPGSTVFLLTSRKIEIAKYACARGLDNSRSQSPQRGS